MWNRRELVAGGLALGIAGPGRAAPAADAKQRAIEGIALPPRFNGALAYARDGRLRHVRCVGLEDIEARRPVTPATQYKWGSASKWLTSVAMLRLAEQGRLDLAAPVTAYLPRFRRDTGSQVRLHHLLSNTSGLADLLSRQLASEPALRTSTASAAEMVTRFGGGDLIFAPGAGWDYAALNWVIVAAVVEAATGQAFEATVERLVLDPLRMTGAGFAQPGQPPLPRLAAAYRDAPTPVRKMDRIPAFAVASGNVAGTLRDAARAAHGIFHGALLRPASQRALRTVRWAPQEYALGGRIHDLDGDAWGWETGKVQGYRTHIAHRLARSETVIIFNTTDLPQSDLTGWIEVIARA